MSLQRKTYRNNKDLIGQRFDRLIVLEKTSKRKAGMVLWLCQCDCGNKTYVISSVLKSGRVCSCGCKKEQFYNRIKRKLTNKRFGRLVAIRPTKQKCGHSICWECRCDCGTIKNISGASLITGATLSCGCLNKELTSKRTKGKRSFNFKNGLSKTSDYQKNDQLNRRYGISLHEYKEILKSQKGVCAICGKNDGRMKNSTVYPLSVDHDHKTGKVRGLLCNSCNSGLGYFQDSLNFLNKAIIYLEKSK